MIDSHGRSSRIDKSVREPFPRLLTEAEARMKPVGILWAPVVLSYALWGLSCNERPCKLLINN
jgi:hypothetical protein